MSKRNVGRQRTEKQQIRAEAAPFAPKKDENQDDYIARLRAMGVPVHDLRDMDDDEGERMIRKVYPDIEIVEG
jgi:hypothetical protein